jgi:hypothetical protein
LKLFRDDEVKGTIFFSRKLFVINHEGAYKRIVKYAKIVIDLGGLVVSVLATGPKVRGFKPDGFLRVIKICSTTSFGGEVKPSVPCRRFTACKKTLRA